MTALSRQQQQQQRWIRNAALIIIPTFTKKKRKKASHRRLCQLGSPRGTTRGPVLGGPAKAAFCLLLHHGTVLLAVLLLARRLNVRGKTELGVNFFYETELHGINSHRLMSHKAIPDQFG